MSTNVPVRNTFTGDGSTTSFQFTFDHELSTESTVVVTLTVGETDTIQTEDVHYTLNSSNKTVTFTNPPVADSTITIERITPRERQIDYQSGSTILEKENLDEDANRLTAVTQEIEGRANRALSLNAAGDAWDAEGLRIENGSPATSGDNYVTLAQLENMIEGGETAEINNGTSICHDGDGSETDFEVTGFRGLNAGQLLVFVEGVHQTVCDEDPAYEVIDSDGSAYPGSDGGPDYVRFFTAPVSGAHIEIRIIRGTVVTTLADEAINDADQIADDVIGTQHINVGAGQDKRFLVLDTDGDPTARIAVHTDISDFDTGVRENTLNQMAVPTDNVSFNDVAKLIGLVAGTASSHAVNKGQMESAISNRLQAKIGTVSNMPTGTGNPNNITGSIGFVPDLLILSARFIDGGPHDYHATYVALFAGSATQRDLSAGRFSDGTDAPTIRFDRDGSGASSHVDAELMTVGDLQAWTFVGYLALKFGDA